jgi:hypothetical protein
MMLVSPVSLRAYVELPTLLPESKDAMEFVKQPDLEKSEERPAVEDAVNAVLPAIFPIDDIFNKFIKYIQILADKSLKLQNCAILAKIPHEHLGEEKVIVLDLLAGTVLSHLKKTSDGKAKIADLEKIFGIAVTINLLMLTASLIAFETYNSDKLATLAQSIQKIAPNWLQKQKLNGISINFMRVILWGLEGVV